MLVKLVVSFEFGCKYTTRERKYAYNLNTLQIDTIQQHNGGQEMGPICQDKKDLKSLLCSPDQLSLVFTDNPKFARIQKFVRACRAVHAFLAHIHVI